MNDRSLVVRGENSLDHRRLALSPHLFAGFRIEVYPSTVYSQQTAKIRIRLDCALDRYRCCLNFGRGWTPWRPAQEWTSHVFDDAPGQQVVVAARLQCDGFESQIEAQNVTVLAQCSLNPDPGHLHASLVAFEDAKIIAVRYGDMLLNWEVATNSTYAQRIGEGLLCPQGFLVSPSRDLSLDRDYARYFEPRITMKDVQTGQVLSQFVPADTESVCGFTCTGEIITQMSPQVSGNVVASAFRPGAIQATKHWTRLWNPLNGQPVALIPGVLRATSTCGVGAYGYFMDSKVTFHHDYHQPDIMAVHHAATVNGTSRITVHVSPSGRFAALPATTEAMGFMATKKHFEIITTDAPCATVASLPDNWRVHRFINDEIVLIEDTQPQNLSKAMMVFNWLTAEVVAYIPLKALANDCGLSFSVDSPDDLLCHFDGDSILPDLVAGILLATGRKTVGLLSKADNYRSLRLMPHEWGVTDHYASIAATPRKVYAGNYDGIDVFDPATAHKEAHISRDVMSSAMSTSGDQPGPAKDHIVLLCSRLNLLQYVKSLDPAAWGRDERTGASFVFSSPGDTVSAELLATDSGTRLLLWLLQADTEATRAYQQQALKRMDAALGTLMGGRLEAGQPEVEAPAYTNALDVWDYIRPGSHLLLPVALPAESSLVGVQAVAQPTEGRWIFLSISRQMIVDRKAKRLFRALLSLDTYLIGYSGNMRAVATRVIEPYVDMGVTCTTADKAGSYKHGLIHEPCIALSPLEPGISFIYSLHTLETTDALSGRTITSVKNPMSTRLGVPKWMTPLPDGRLRVQFAAEPPIIVDPRGNVAPEIDPMPLLTAHDGQIVGRFEYGQRCWYPWSPE